MSDEGNHPSQSFKRILKMARMCGAFVGMDVASPNFRLNRINFFVIFCIFCYYIFSIITIVSVFEENPTFVLEASCMLGSVLQGTSKLMSGFAFTKNVVKIRFELEELYDEYEQKSSEFIIVLNSSCRRVKKVIKLFGLSYIYGITGVIIVPITLHFVTKKHYMMMHFLLPGLDVETKFGYYLTLTAHTVCMYLGGFGLYAGDLFIVIYLLQAMLFADIFKLKIKELNASLKDGEPVQKQRDLLRDIISWHKKYNDYNICCNKSFYYVISVQITTAGISILCTLYIFIAGDWPGVYAYFMLPVLSLYAYCLLGTKIQICNDRFANEILDIDWFKLPKAEQHLVLIMLMKSQRPANIDIAGVMPLSVETGLQITKTIYSIFMMMVQTLDI